MIEAGPIQTKWIEALESGKYVQGRGDLRRDGKYCCLGVLCEVMGVPKNRTGNYEHNSIGLKGCLSEQLVIDAGLYDVWGAGHGVLSLVAVNDSGETFVKIAAALRTGVYFKELR